MIKGIDGVDCTNLFRISRIARLNRPVRRTIHRPPGSAVGYSNPPRGLQYEELQSPFDCLTVREEARKR